MHRSLKGENLVSIDVFEIVEDGSPAHGHVDAAMTAMRRLDFSRLICTRRSRQRDIVVAMVAARILEPRSKLATTSWWADTTLPEMLDVCDADENDLYDERNLSENTSPLIFVKTDSLTPSSSAPLLSVQYL